MSLKKVINFGPHLQNNLLSNFTKHSYKEFYRECLPFSHIRTGSRIPLMNCSPMFTRVSIDTKNVQLAVSKRTFECSFLKLPHFFIPNTTGIVPPSRYHARFCYSKQKRYYEFPFFAFVYCCNSVCKIVKAKKTTAVPRRLWGKCLCCLSLMCWMLWRELDVFLSCIVHDSASFEHSYCFYYHILSFSYDFS